MNGEDAWLLQDGTTLRKGEQIIAVELAANGVFLRRSRGRNNLAPTETRNFEGATDVGLWFLPNEDGHDRGKDLMTTIPSALLGHPAVKWSLESRS